MNTQPSVSRRILFLIQRVSENPFNRLPTPRATEDRVVELENVYEVCDNNRWAELLLSRIITVLLQERFGNFEFALWKVLESDEIIIIWNNNMYN